MYDAEDDGEQIEEAAEAERSYRGREVVHRGDLLLSGTHTGQGSGAGDQQTDGVGGHVMLTGEHYRNTKCEILVKRFRQTPLLNLGVITKANGLLD